MSGQNVNIKDVVREWDQAWRCTELWRELFAAGDDEESLARALLTHLSNPARPREILQALFSEGAFDAIEELLDKDEFRSAAVESDLESIAQQLAADREESRGEIELNISYLERRARTVFKTLPASDPAVASAIARSTRDRRQARESLRDGELRIAAAEDEALASLKSHFNAREEGADALWIEAVRRGLQARDIELVSSLLAGVPEPNVVYGEPLPPPPKLGILYGDADPASICRWILDGFGGSRDFYANWMPDRTQAVDSVLRKLLGLRTEARIDLQTVTELAGDVGRLLVGSDEPQPAVARGGWVLCQLPCLAEAACPGVAAVKLTLAVRAELEDIDSHLSDCAEVGAVLVVLTARSQERSLQNLVVVTPWDIVRFLKQPEHFRINFLRHICQQLPRGLLLPSDDRQPGLWLGQFPQQDGSAPFRGTSFSALRSAAERCMDLSGHNCDGRALDRLACYAAGRPALLLGLLRSLFADLDERASPRESKVLAQDVESAFFSPRYEATVNGIVFSPLQTQPELMLVLSATMFCAEPEPAYGRVAKTNDVFEWAGVGDFGPDESTVMRSLKELERQGLVELFGGQAQVRLVNPTGIFAMLHKLGPAASERFYDRARNAYLGAHS